MNRTRWLYSRGILLLFAAPLDALARIKLTTLPVRERVEIQLDHPQIALVEEERIVPLVKGVNQVDFSWANTRIDPDTLVLRILPSPPEQPLDARVLSVSYPPNENALVWAVAASDSGAVRVRISYVLGGLSKDFHYRAVADRDEKTLNLAQLLRVNNNANEAYASAEFWAGVGERFSKPLGLSETKEVQLSRFAALPVGAQSESARPDSRHALAIRATTKVLPVPAPPEITLMRLASAVRYASRRASPRSASGAATIGRPGPSQAYLASASRIDRSSSRMRGVVTAFPSATRSPRSSSRVPAASIMPRVPRATMP